MADDIADVPPTIAELPFFAGGRHPRPDLLGRCGAGAVTWVSGRNLVEQVRDLSLGLTAMGMQRGDRVALLCESRPEWLLADFAILAAGAVTTPIYPTLSVDQIGLILRDAGISLAIASTPALAANLVAAAVESPGLTTIVTIEATRSGPAAGGITMVSLADVSARGHQQILDGWGVGRAFHDQAKQVRPEDPATLIYTSGTTGTPKGVLLTHANLIANVIGVRQVLKLDEADTALSFLPLSHAFERLVAYVYLTCGVSMVFAESLDTVARDMAAVRPTVMTGVPRVFEKLQERVLAAGRSATGVKRAIFDWSVRVAERRGAVHGAGRSPGAGLRLAAAVADRLVFRRIRERLGGRLRFAVSGGAKLRADVARFFYGVGVPILEGYGLTETSPVLCVMPLEKIKFGSVGPPLPNVEIRIADDGEILARGPNVMGGYFRRPEDTAAVLRDGWFHTGDIGVLDADGYLSITDRKKDLLVTAGGKKIASSAIEAALKAYPEIDEAVVIAEQRRFPAVLLVPNLDEVCRLAGCPRPLDTAGVEALAARDDVRARLQAIVDAVNAPLAHFERIKKVAVLPAGFSQATGELTPTLKVKRRVVEEKYRGVIERLYADSAE